jgi:hypothetical protein
VRRLVAVLTRRIGLLRLEKVGAEFIPENGGGAAVRLAKSGNRESLQVGKTVGAAYLICNASAPRSRFLVRPGEPVDLIDINPSEQSNAFYSGSRTIDRLEHLG